MSTFKRRVPACQTPVRVNPASSTYLIRAPHKRYQLITAVTKSTESNTVMREKDFDIENQNKSKPQQDFFQSFELVIRV